MIRQGILSDTIDSKALTEACAQHLLEQGIAQWNENYPSLEVLKKDLAAGNSYVYIINGDLVGTVMFSQEKDPVYDPIQWLSPEEGAYYVHRLAVHPLFQKQGIARALMDFVEEEVLRIGGQSIRLDTFSKNIRNQRFYKARGYTQLGMIYFPHKSEHPFHCFEKVLHTHNS